LQLSCGRLSRNGIVEQNEKDQPARGIENENFEPQHMASPWNPASATIRFWPEGASLRTMPLDFEKGLEHDEN